MLFFRPLSVLIFTIVFYFAAIMERIILCQTITSQNEESIINAEMILTSFCQLDQKLKVMECVDQETQGQALIPWNLCLNSDFSLTKRKVIDLSCKTLLPQYSLILSMLTSCVNSQMSPDEAAVWMPIMEDCAQEATDSIRTDGTVTVPGTSTNTQLTTL